MKTAFVMSSVTRSRWLGTRSMQQRQRSLVNPTPRDGDNRRYNPVACLRPIPKFNSIPNYKMGHTISIHPLSASYHTSSSSQHASGISSVKSPHSPPSPPIPRFLDPRPGVTSPRSPSRPDIRLTIGMGRWCFERPPPALSCAIGQCMSQPVEESTFASPGRIPSWDRPGSPRAHRLGAPGLEALLGSDGFA